jgi:hypothetical protein
MRGTGLAEENVLATADRRNNDEMLDRVFAACFKATVEPGPYDIKNGAAPVWGSLLQCDRFVLMIKLRCLSYVDGHLYEIDAHHDECDMRFPWEVDLKEDLPIRKLTEDAVERVKTGQPFECNVGGKLVKYKLPTVKDMALSEKLQEQFPERAMAAMLRARLVEVEGVEKRDWMEWLDGANGESTKFKGLDSDEAEALRDAYDLSDGGVDTEIEITCKRVSCRQRFVQQLPFDQGFLLPARGIRARKRARRLGKESSDD